MITDLSLVQYCYSVILAPWGTYEYDYVTVHFAILDKLLGSY